MVNWSFNCMSRGTIFTFSCVYNLNVCGAVITNFVKSLVEFFELD